MAGLVSSSIARVIYLTVVAADERLIIVGFLARSALAAGEFIAHGE